MGTQEATDPKSTGVSDDLLRGSLFSPSSSTSLTIDLPPATKEGLAQIGVPYKALWISYLYFDIDQSRSVEECTETISIGRTKMAFSPDVLHRLQHFLTAFKHSNEANPASSKGIYMYDFLFPSGIWNFEDHTYLELVYNSILVT